MFNKRSCSRLNSKIYLADFDYILVTFGHLLTLAGFSDRLLDSEEFFLAALSLSCSLYAFTNAKRLSLGELYWTGLVPRHTFTTHGKNSGNKNVCDLV